MLRRRCSGKNEPDRSFGIWTLTSPLVVVRGTRLVVQSLCGLGLVDLVPAYGELGWGEVAVRGVGSVGVVVAAPVFDDHAGFQQLSRSAMS